MDFTYPLGLSFMGALLLISLIIVCHAVNNPIERSKKLLWLLVSMVLYVPVAGYISLMAIISTLQLVSNEPVSSIPLTVIWWGIFYPILFLFLPALTVREARKTIQEK